MQRQKGFTIIELIVVIAIIAVLAGIVLVSVNQYITKSRDAAIKANMAEFPAFANKYFETYGSYEAPGGGNVCEGKELDDTQPPGIIYTYEEQIGKLTKDGVGDFGCNASATEWASCTDLNSGENWCVDSTGAKIDLSTVSGGATRCSNIRTHTGISSCQ